MDSPEGVFGAAVDQFNLTDIITLIRQLPAEQRDLLLQRVGFANEEALWNLLEEKMKVKTYESFLMQYEEFKVHKLLLLYVPPILLFLGTFGNIFSFVILRQRSMTRLSTYFYLAMLSIADCLVLYVGLLRKWIGELTSVDIQDKSNWLCKIIVVLGYLTSDLSVWLIIAVTVERYIVVCHPLRANIICNTSRAKKLIVILFFVLLIINSHFFWTVEIFNVPLRNGDVVPKCSGVNPYEELVNDVWPWVDAIIYSFLPFTIITVMNCLIVRQVLKARRSRIVMCKNDIGAQQMRKGYTEGSTKLTILLLTVSFTFLVTTLPMNITLIVTAFWNTTTHDKHNTARFFLVKTITELLMYVNHSVNFFLYCAAGQKFRHQIFVLLCNNRQPFRPSMSEYSPSSFRKKQSFMLNHNTVILDSDENLPPMKTDV